MAVRLHSRGNAEPEVRSPGPAAETTCHAWYESYGRHVYSYLRFHLPTADLAEDLTAEVFLRALRKFERFDPARGTAQSWLLRIAQNVLRDHQRQVRRRPALYGLGLRDLEYQAPSPEERVLWEEEVGRLLSAVSELKPRDREIIGLCYGSELSPTEAGEILGLSDTAVRTRLWRALGRLRKVLSCEPS